MMSDDGEAIARLSRVYRAGAAVRVGPLTYRSQYFPALSVAGIRQFSPVSTCQGEGRGFESRRPLQNGVRSLDAPATPGRCLGASSLEHRGGSEIGRAS